MVFVTTTVRDWTKLFADQRLALIALRQLAHSAAHFDASVVAYVLMPSHLHTLLGCRKIENLSKLLNNFKSLSSRSLVVQLPSHLKKAFLKGDRYSIWKPRFDDLIVWSEKQFRTKIEYIHNNPVKAGFVTQAEEYPYSSARNWLCGEPGIIEIDREWTWLQEG